jgi:hypothetical protein
VLAPLGPELERPGLPPSGAGSSSCCADRPAGTAASRDSLTARLVWDAPRRGGRLRDLVHGWTLTRPRCWG